MNQILMVCALALAFLSPAPVQSHAPKPAPVTELANVAFVSVSGWTCFVVIGDDLFPVGPYEDSAGDMLLAPGIAEVSYVDAKGNTVKVTIPCSNYLTEEACWAAAKKSLAAAEKHFPKPVPAKD